MAETDASKELERLINLLPKEDLSDEDYVILVKDIINTAVKIMELLSEGTTVNNTGGSSGTIDAYTKAETDKLLSDLEVKLKADLGSSVEGYTKEEIDTKVGDLQKEFKSSLDELTTKVNTAQTDANTAKANIASLVQEFNTYKSSIQNQFDNLDTNDYIQDEATKSKLNELLSNFN